VRIASILLLFAAGGAPILAQAEVDEAVHEVQEAELAVSLETGQIWRQNVRFESVITGADGVEAVWTFDYSLRLRCLEPVPGGFSVAGQFLDWRLRLQKGACSYEWQDGRYSYFSEHVDQAEESHSACRCLLAAWSSGLRDAEIRFLLRRDGTVTGLSGLEKLHATVAESLDSAGELPAEMLAFFGQDGLKRADGALGLALSVPRPVEQVGPGSTWTQVTDVHSLAAADRQVRRTFHFAGLGRERRFRFAEIAIAPAFEVLDERGEWRLVESSAKEEQAEVLKILLDSGLLYQMNAELRFELPDGSRAHFRLSSQFGD